MGEDSTKHTFSHKFVYNKALDMRYPPKISVITPSFNQDRYIERTIRSVLEQRYSNLEYIVVDGGSTDETIEILKRYEGKLRWISERDEGQSDAINKGIKMATGDIIAYLNSDDMYEESALKKVADFFRDNPSKMWLLGKCRIIDESDREVRRAITFYKNLWLNRYSYNTLLITNFISQPAVFLRRELVEEIGLFNVAQHRVMDYEYWLKAGRKYFPGIINEYLAKFRVHSSSKTSSSFWHTFREELEVSKKHSDSHTINALHYLNYIGICSVYALIGTVLRVRGK